MKPTKFFVPERSNTRITLERSDDGTGVRKITIGVKGRYLELTAKQVERYAKSLAALCASGVLVETRDG